MRSSRSKSARFGLAALIFSMLTLTLAPSAAAVEPTEYELVYATAHAQLGDQWQHRAKGPSKFDCSGLVWYAFSQNALATRIGLYRSVAGYYNWFKMRGQASRSDPKPGDLVIWGSNQHIGIYVGDGKAISTLTTRRGVTIHPVFGYLGVRFKTYLHVDLTRPVV